MKKIKVGVFGAGRGMDIAHYFMMLGCEIVALCERDKERSDKVLKKLPETATVYRDFDEFIECCSRQTHMILRNYENGTGNGVKLAFLT